MVSLKKDGMAEMREWL